MSLAGKRVLITRPAAQNQELAKLIEQEAAVPLLLPLLEIQAFAESDIASALDNIQCYDKIVFISRNAAKIALQYLHANNIRLRDEQCIALGEASLQILLKANYQPEQAALAYATSETLLQEAVFSDSAIAGKRIMIVRGQGGRETLAEELSRRGARVDYADIYTRQKVTYSLAQKREIIAAQPDVIVLTSNEGIEAYYELFNLLDMTWLESLGLVVFSERNKDFARKLGFKGVIHIAKQTSDQGLVDACKKHFN